MILIHSMTTGSPVTTACMMVTSVMMVVMANIHVGMPVHIDVGMPVYIDMSMPIHINMSMAVHVDIHVPVYVYINMTISATMMIVHYNNTWASSVRIMGKHGHFSTNHRTSYHSGHHGSPHSHSASTSIVLRRIAISRSIVAVRLRIHRFFDNHSGLIYNRNLFNNSSLLSWHNYSCGLLLWIGLTVH
jgi:hypothetical protein